MALRLGENGVSINPTRLAGKVYGTILAAKKEKGESR